MIPASWIDRSPAAIWRASSRSRLSGTVPSSSSSTRSVRPSTYSMTRTAVSSSPWHTISGAQRPHDVLVLDAAAQVGLPLEARPEPALPLEVGVDHLHGDRRLAAVHGGPVDRPHPPVSEVLAEPVPSDAGVLHEPSQAQGTAARNPQHPRGLESCTLLAGVDP